MSGGLSTTKISTMRVVFRQFCFMCLRVLYILSVSLLALMFNHTRVSVLQMLARHEKPHPVRIWGLKEVARFPIFLGIGWS